MNVCPAKPTWKGQEARVWDSQCPCRPVTQVGPLGSGRGQGTHQYSLECSTSVYVSPSPIKVPHVRQMKHSGWYFSSPATWCRGEEGTAPLSSPNSPHRSSPRPLLRRASPKKQLWGPGWPAAELLDRAGSIDGGAEGYRQTVRLRKRGTLQRPARKDNDGRETWSMGSAWTPPPQVSVQGRGCSP